MMNRNVDGSPSDSSSGVFVSGPVTVTESVNEEGGDDLDSDYDEQLSQTSSVGSVSGRDGQPIRVQDVIFFDAALCRVFMTRTKNGNKIFCVCGCSRETCTRKGHQEKARLEVHRAPPRYYEQFPVTRGNDRGVIDGRLDSLPVGLTPVEVDRMRIAEDLEMTRVATALGVNEESEDNEDGVEGRNLETETPMGTGQLRAALAGAAATLDRELESVRRVTFTGRDQRAEAPAPVLEGQGMSTPQSHGESPEVEIVLGAAPRAPTRQVNDASTRTPTTQRWYGIEEVGTGIRRICTGNEDLEYWLDHGATFRPFRTQKEAKEWVRMRNERAEPRNRWYGMVRQQRDGHRRLCREISEMEVLLEQGYSHARTFKDRELAELWRDTSPAATSTKQGRTSRAEPKGSSIRRAAKSKSTEEEWFGLTEAPGDSRVICQRISEKDELMRTGAEWRRTFKSEQDATAWVEATVPAPVAQKAMHKPDSSQGHEKILEEISEAYEKHHGDDPSTGDETRIFGIETADADGMERALCPPGLDERDRVEFLNRSMDVAALPGTYMMEADDDVSTGEELAVSLLQQLDSKRKETTGHDSLWQTKRAHGLGTIKSATDLTSMIKNILKAWKTAWKAQQGRWRAFLYERRYPKKVVDEYLRLGLLPRVIQATYQNYLGLVQTARELLHTKDGSVTTWKGSRSEALIKHHGGKLRDHRSYSPNYRTFVQNVYSYLRDAAKETEYRHETMLDPVWEEVAALRKLVEAKNPTGETPPTPGGEVTRCGWCHRKNLHPEGKNNCPGKDLTAVQARKLLKGVPKTAGIGTIKQGCVNLAGKVTADSNADVDELIKQERVSQFGMED